MALDDERALEEIVAKRIKIKPEDIAGLQVLRRGIDARRYRGAPIHFVYMVQLRLQGKESEQTVLRRCRRDNNVSAARVEPEKAPAIMREHRPDDLRPIVVGFGPAGMLAALQLAKAGWQPLVLERGLDVDARQAAVEHFWQTGELDVRTNVQFGEGGAGTFSDGKLTSRSSDPHIRDVLETFVAAGAPDDILYLQKPHIGTDKLRPMVRNIRQQIIELGGEVQFGAQVTDIELDAAGCVQAVIVNGEERIEADAVFLGIGHSARDTYRMLQRRGLVMEPKAFAMGVRIEHPQELIDRNQYGVDAGHPLLPAADYALTFQDREGDGRGAYSFCMCPGGFVVAAASELGRVVTNGMSNYARDSGIANSALLVQVSPADFGTNALSGMALQEKLESLAFALGGSDYRAPVQSVGDFLSGRSGSTDFLVTPTYRPGVKPADLHDCLPDYITATLERALPHFNKKIPGFASADVPMTGIEARSSAPCRLRRDRATFMAEQHSGIYPIGEGAGYAGGIMSAAVDGLRAALAFLSETK